MSVSRQHPLEALLRPPVELNTTVAAWSAAAISLAAPATLMMPPGVAESSALWLIGLGAWRAAQAWRIIRYKRGLRWLPRYVLAAGQIPCSRDGLFLGKGFRWTQVHTQRLWDLSRPHARRYLEPGRLSGRARQWLEAVGGLPALHGVGLPEGETEIRLPGAERQGHMFYVGTTGVGKTRAAELAISQDIRAGHPVIVLDPKGDPDLFRRVYAEAGRAQRPFYFFHLGYPEHSCRYNPIGRFERVTEVATRIANQLPGEGNAAAFRQFAWLFVNVIARALVALGERPNYRLILRHMNTIEPLLIRYFEHWLAAEGPPEWRAAVADGEEDRKGLSAHLKDRDRRAIALVRYYKAADLYDPVADGLRRAWEYEKSYFDKISVAVQPLLEKLLSGPIARLLNPDYADPEDARPLLSWESVIRQRAVVYAGFDALTDPEVATVVGQSMVADLVAYAGHIYKHGTGHGLPGGDSLPETHIHMDEFNELVRGPEIVQALNKGRGAGLRFAVYTQTLADVEAGLGSRARAAQVAGNVTNTIVMLRVADADTAELLTKRLDRVEVNALTLVSGATDSADPASPVHFTSSAQERISSQVVPLLEPAHVMKLPKGQAFVLMQGGQLYKVRLPLPDPHDVELPPDLEAVAAEMRRRYQPGPVTAWAARLDQAALTSLEEPAP